MLVETVALLGRLARLHQALGAEPAAVEERQVGATQAALGQGGQRLAVAQAVEQHGAGLEQAGPGPRLEEALP